MEEVEDAGGFPGHGHRDIYGAVSLDDGSTWKRTNLSRSGDESSFTLKDGTAYPGDVIRLFDAVAGKRVLAVWSSRYCRGGAPNYAMDVTQRDAIAVKLEMSVDDLYLNDLFGVSGSQGSSDFTGETILDPRYAPASPLKTSIEPNVYEVTDTRDPSKYFVVFETGDNTTVEFGEAEPLDLYYSRAFNWGDDYELVDTDGDNEGDYFDWLEGSSKVLSGEAALAASPGGDFLYAIWNQETVNKYDEVIESDAWFRRVMFLDEEVVTPPSGDDPSGTPNPDAPKPGKN